MTIEEFKATCTAEAQANNQTVVFVTDKDNCEAFFRNKKGYNVDYAYLLKGKILPRRA